MTGDEDLHEQRPLRYMLFVCVQNAGRSQMAQAFGPSDVVAESAGTEPAREISPVVVEVMREAGIDISGRRPKGLSLEIQIHADWAVTMGCGDACPYVASAVDAWDIPDPAGRPIAELRAIRDGIEAQVRELRVRTHILALAHRQTRECLRQESCHLLGGNA